MTNQDVDTEYSEAGHTPTETDYYYEETVPEGEVIGEEEIPVQVKKKMTHWSGHTDKEQLNSPKTFYINFIINIHENY